MKKICRTDLIAEINLDFIGSVLQSSVHARKLQTPQASNPKATLIFCNKFEEVSRVDFLLCRLRHPVQ